MATIISLVAGTSLGMAAALNADRCPRGQRQPAAQRTRAGASPTPSSGLLVYYFGQLAVLHGRRLRPVPRRPGGQHQGDDPPAITLGIFGRRRADDGRRRPRRDDGAVHHGCRGGATGHGAPSGARPAQQLTVQVLTQTATYVGYLLSGAIIVEQLFTLPGFGVYVLTACPTVTTPWSRPGCLSARRVHRRQHRLTSATPPSTRARRDRKACWVMTTWASLSLLFKGDGLSAPCRRARRPRHRRAARPALRPRRRPDRACRPTGGAELGLPVRHGLLGRPMLPRSSRGSGRCSCCRPVPC